MKADRNSDGKEGLTVLTGNVIQKKFAEGSKSEHTAIYLQTETMSYQLRRLGANAFADPKLKGLVGKKVKAKGLLNDTLFIAHSIEAI